MVSGSHFSLTELVKPLGVSPLFPCCSSAWWKEKAHTTKKSKHGPCHVILQNETRNHKNQKESLAHQPILKTKKEAKAYYLSSKFSKQF